MIIDHRPQKLAPFASRRQLHPLPPHCPEAGHGALIGNQPIAPGSAVPLRGGERIQLGETALEFIGRG